MIAMLAAAAAALSPAPTTYQVNLMIAREDGEMRSVTEFDTQIVLRDGAVLLSQGQDGVDPLLHGDFVVDEAKGEVFAAFKICEPERDPCEPLATPSLTFRLGEPAAINMTGGEYSINLSFSPVTE